MKRVLWLLLLTAACTSNRTEMVVIVNQQGLVVGRDFDSVHLTITDVTQADATRFDSQDLPICSATVTSNCYDLPLVQTLFPGSKSPHDAVRVLVEATLKTTTVISDAATFTFVSGQSSQLDFTLVSACLGNTTCSAQDEVCGSAGSCTTLAPTKLTGNPDLRTAGEPVDAAVGDASAVLDGGMHDAGPHDAALTPPDLTKPTCSDHIKNGDEGGVDCGGSCTTLCMNGSTCNVAADCVSFVCGHNGMCVDLAFSAGTTQTETDPCSVVAADFTRTSHPGYALALGGPQQVLIFSNTNGASFSQAQMLTFSAGPQSLLVQAINKANEPDLFVLQVNGSPASPTSLVFDEPGGGGFQTAGSAITGNDNGQGAFDTVTNTLFVASNSGIELFTIGADGSFTAGPTITSEGAASGVAIGHIDGNASPDIAFVTQNNGFEFALASGVGASSYGTPTVVGNKEEWQSSAVLKDLDGDGHPDAIIGNVSGYVTIYWGTGTGFVTSGSSLQLQTLTQVGQCFVPLVADVNNDGIPDVLAACRGTSTVGSVDVFLNHGKSRVFETDVSTVLPSQRPYSIDVADFDGDKWNDIVVATRYGSVSGVTVITNSSP